MVKIENTKKENSTSYEVEVELNPKLFQNKNMTEQEADKETPQRMDFTVEGSRDCIGRNDIPYKISIIRISKKWEENTEVNTESRNSMPHKISRETGELPMVMMDHSSAEEQSLPESQTSGENDDSHILIPMKLPARAPALCMVSVCDEY